MDLKNEVSLAGGASAILVPGGFIIGPLVAAIPVALASS